MLKDSQLVQNQTVFKYLSYLKGVLPQPPQLFQLV